MTDDRQGKIQAMREDLAAFPDLLARFNEIHPPSSGPTTIEEALLGVAHDARDATTNIPTMSPWYDDYLDFVKELQWRSKFAVPCSLEAFILH